MDRSGRSKLTRYTFGSAHNAHLEDTGGGIAGETFGSLADTQGAKLNALTQEQQRLESAAMQRVAVPSKETGDSWSDNDISSIEDNGAAIAFDVLKGGDDMRGTAGNNNANSNGDSRAQTLQVRDLWKTQAINWGWEDGDRYTDALNNNDFFEVDDEGVDDASFHADQDVHDRNGDDDDTVDGSEPVITESSQEDKVKDDDGGADEKKDMLVTPDDGTRQAANTSDGDESKPVDQVCVPTDMMKKQPRTGENDAPNPSTADVDLQEPITEKNEGKPTDGSSIGAGQQKITADDNVDTNNGENKDIDQDDAGADTRDVDGPARIDETPSSDSQPMEIEDQTIPHNDDDDDDDDDESTTDATNVDQATEQHDTAKNEPSNPIITAKALDEDDVVANSVDDDADSDDERKRDMSAVSKDVSQPHEAMIATNADESQPISEEKHNSSKPPSQNAYPTIEHLITSTDMLFVQADIETVTVKNIVESLEAEHGVKFLKKTKKWVRSHLKALVEGSIEPTVANDTISDSDDDGSVGSDANAAGIDGDDISDQGDSESDADISVSVGGDVSDESDDGDEYSVENGSSQRDTKKTKTSGKRSASISRRGSKTGSGRTKKINRKRSNVKRPSALTKTQREAAKEARRLNKEMRRQRMNELKTRNEELQQSQQKESKEDQERAEAIAARLETDTLELRNQRLEDRLNLLQRLDKTRISVVEKPVNGSSHHIQDGEPNVTTNDTNTNNSNQSGVIVDGGNTVPIDDGSHDNATSSPQPQPQSNALSKSAQPQSSGGVDADSDDDSDDGNECDEHDYDDDDELELEFDGIPKRLSHKPLVRMHLDKAKTALSFLNNKAPSRTKPARKPSAVASSTNDRKAMAADLTSISKESKESHSPSKSLGARAILRNILVQKQRKMGNRWLARELGYKTEQDHLEDCRKLEDKKRSQVLMMEKLRLQSNERKLLRERLLEEKEEGQPNTLKVADTGVSSSAATNQAGNAVGNASASTNGENSGASDQVEEVDEEMEMAKQIESEQDKDTMPIDEAVDTTAPLMSAPTHDSAIDPSPMTQSVDHGISTTLCEEASSNAGSNSKDAPSNEPEATGSTDASKNDAAATPVVVDQAGAESESLPPPTEKSTNIMDTNNVTHNEIGNGIDVDIGIDDSDADSNAESTAAAPVKSSNKPRNAMWKAMLEKEAQNIKKQKQRKGRSDLVEAEAEEEEEEAVAGLEEFGFTIKKKKDNDDEDDDEDGKHDRLEADDLEHIVDELSDDEGDEEAGEDARKKIARMEEKRRHKEILRRMREGYDGRRGGIAGGGGMGARGNLRFDQLVAADNREDAKRLGLLNDDELDSDDDANDDDDESKENDQAGGNKKAGDVDEDEDEVALLDKMLKDRFLQRSDIDLEEAFSEDEDEEEDDHGASDLAAKRQDQEERTQERLAKRFAKRARMQRLEDVYGKDDEFTQRRLIDEDDTMKQELQKMKNGLIRKRSVSSTSRASFASSSNSSSRLFGAQSVDTPDNPIANDSNVGTQMQPAAKRQRIGAEAPSGLTQSLSFRTSSLGVALLSSRKLNRKTSFLGSKVSKR